MEFCLVWLIDFMGFCWVFTIYAAKVGVFYWEVKIGLFCWIFGLLGSKSMDFAVSVEVN
jgi:hypothetical protein